MRPAVPTSGCGRACDDHEARLRGGAATILLADDRRADRVVLAPDHERGCLDAGQVLRQSARSSCIVASPDGPGLSARPSRPTRGSRRGRPAKGHRRTRDASDGRLRPATGTRRRRGRVGRLDRGDRPPGPRRSIRPSNGRSRWPARSRGRSIVPTSWSATTSSTKPMTARARRRTRAGRWRRTGRSATAPGRCEPTSGTSRPGRGGGAAVGRRPRPR